MTVRSLSTIKILPITVFIILLIIPFFWLKPGEMDLGGDSSRLYFYDPGSYIKNVVWYGIYPEGMNVVMPNYYYLPFVSLLYVLNQIFNSPSFTITLLNSIKLAFSFLSIYLIMLELSKKSTEKKDIAKHILVATISGLFYTFSVMMSSNWDKALLSHNQVFLNPLIFYLIFKYFLTSNIKYGITFLLLSFVFAPAFSLTSAPPFFAFYPLAISFILIYTLYFKKIKINSKKMIFLLILYFLIHAFHLIPQLNNLFQPGSFTNTRVFDKESIAEEGVRYFTAVLPLAKVSTNLLHAPLSQVSTLLAFLFPGITVVGLLLSRRTHKAHALTALFFIVTLFLLSANITTIGVEIYKSLFYIPGFSMFRNFIGQWIFVYVFFYALLFGLSLSEIYDRTSLKLSKAISISLGIIIIFQSIGFIRGDIINKIHYDSKKVKIPIIMDPAYKDFLSTINAISQDAKILTLPYTDSYYQVLAGEKGGAYIGPSTISALTEKRDFVGYQAMTSKFSEELFTLSRKKDYEGIKKLLGVLNINYIFHNEDNRIYDSYFPTNPYNYSRQSLPTSQKEYKKFIKDLGAVEIKRNKTYVLYRMRNVYYLPHHYIPSNIITYKEKSPKIVEVPFLRLNTDKKKNVAYINDDICKNISCRSYASGSRNSLVVDKMNDAKYKILIKNTNSNLLLIFQDAYSPSWKAYYNKVISSENNNAENIVGNFISREYVLEKKHIIVNGYANGWLLNDKDLKKMKGQVITIEMSGQSIFYVSLAISLLTFTSIVCYTLKKYFFTRLIPIIMKIK